MAWNLGPVSDALVRASPARRGSGRMQSIGEFHAGFRALTEYPADGLWQNDMTYRRDHDREPFRRAFVNGCFHGCAFGIKPLRALHGPYPLSNSVYRPISGLSSKPRSGSLNARFVRGVKLEGGLNAERRAVLEHNRHAMDVFGWQQLESVHQNEFERRI